LTTDSATNDVDVILLDDAFQHRYVEPGINILLVNYHRLTVYDKLLPAGRLREPKQGKARADIVIITKCPNNLRPLEYRMLIKMMNLYPYQSLYFTSMEYGKMTQLFGEKERNLEDINKDEQIMLLTGIASPKQMLSDLQEYTDAPITHLSFGDHYQFKPKDIRRINDTFSGMSSPKMIITTEKDAARLLFVEGLSDEVKEHLYILPIHVRFMLEQEEEFNNKIISYVRKNSRNSIFIKAKNDHKSQNSHHLGNGVGPISFGNN
jgi:tetraacyldisaccharide-1-P 4'-kinase